MACFRSLKRFFLLVASLESASKVQVVFAQLVVVVAVVEAGAVQEGRWAADVAVKEEIDLDLGGHKSLVVVDRKDILAVQSYLVAVQILFQIDLAEVEDSSRHNLEEESSGSDKGTRRGSREDQVEELAELELPEVVLVSRSSNHVSM